MVFISHMVFGWVRSHRSLVSATVGAESNRDPEALLQCVPDLWDRVFPGAHMDSQIGMAVLEHFLSHHFGLCLLPSSKSITMLVSHMPSNVPTVL